MKNLLLCSLLTCVCFGLFAQTQTAEHLIPRLTSDQRSNMHQPPNGLLVFDTDTESFWYFQAGYWMDLNSGKGGKPATYPLRSAPAMTGQVKVIVDGQEKIVVDSAHLSVLFPDSSTIIGFEAGKENAIVTGSTDDQGKYNTFIGLQAGFRNNDDPSNCSAYAFFNIYEGGCSANNTFLGTRAGYKNSLGRNNTFIGSRAGFSNLGSGGFFSAGEGGTGAENTFVGFLSGHFNQNGYWNTFLGAYSGEMNGMGTLSEFVGRFNTYIGTSAGRFNKFGVENVYVGTQAGGDFDNDAGERNVYLGYRSGYFNTGSDNTYIGHFSGSGDPFSPGERNVYIGTSAGKFASGSDNVFLGFQAGNTLNASDRLIIGNLNTPQLISGRFDTAMVQVNGQLIVNDNNEASLTEDGALTIGQSTSLNLTMDRNEIQARAAGLQSDLSLQPQGGQVVVGSVNDLTSFKLFVEAASGTSPFRARQGGSTKLMVHANGGVSAGTFSTPPANGLSVGGDVNLFGDRIDRSGNLTMEATGKLTIKAGQHTITIDPLGNITIDSDNSVNITSDFDINLTAGDDIVFTAIDDIVLDSGGDILADADGRTDITGSTELELNSDNFMDINAFGTMDIDGSGNVFFNAGSKLDLVGNTELELNSNSVLDINASGTCSIDGSIINLNASNGGATGAARVSSLVSNPPCVGGCVGVVNTGSNTVLIGN